MQTEVVALMAPARAVALMLRVTLTLTLVALCACASLEPVTPKRPAAEALTAAEATAQAEAESAMNAATRAQALAEPQYLRFKANETQLTRAQDDGRFVYLEFASAATADLAFFDQDGRPLTVAAAGQVVAIDGLHAGILVRRAGRASFVSPNPRALSLPRRPLPETADYGEARAKLENQGGQLQAMQRALEAARSNVNAAPAVAAPAQAYRSYSYAQPYGGASASGALAAPAHGTAQQSGESLQAARLRHLQQLPRSGFSPTVALPLAAANASASAPERGLIRVYFATASRAIVAPDDGLGLLLREAGKADEIRVTGFTDATGSRATNEALARARADAVVQILLRRGIPGDRIFSSAVGADDYIADNGSVKGRALNRRAEVLLLRNGVPLVFEDAARATR